MLPSTYLSLRMFQNIDVRLGFMSFRFMPFQPPHIRFTQLGSRLFNFPKTFEIEASEESSFGLDSSSIGKSYVSFKGLIGQTTKGTKL